MHNRTLHSLSLILLIIAMFTLTVRAADINGTWTSEFDTEIGLQKYTFSFKQDGTKITGKAISDIEGEKHEVELQDGKLEGDTITFI